MSQQQTPVVQQQAKAPVKPLTAPVPLDLKLLAQVSGGTTASTSTSGPTNVW